MSAKRDSGNSGLNHGREVKSALVRATSGAAPLIPHGSSVLVGCSGGADSVGLAIALCELARSSPALNLRVAVGHIDHGLREESSKEASAVKELSSSLGVPFLLEKLDGAALSRAMAREGLEGGAREMRYAALERLAKSCGASMVATAHTRRDQAETVLLRIARGGALGALAGIRASRRLGEVQLVRPILEVSREDTESLCRSRGVSFADDPHNRDPQRARARIRAGFAQLAGLLNPRLEEHLAAAASTAAEEDSLLDALARTALDEACAHFQDAPDRSNAARDRSHADGYSIAPLAALPDALLRRALLIAARNSGARPERIHLRKLCAQLRRGQGAIDLPGARALLGAGQLRFQPRQNSPKAPRSPQPLNPILSTPNQSSMALAESIPIPGPGRYLWRSRLLEIEAETSAPIAPEKPASPPDTLRVDAARAPFPWTLRGSIPGDKFRPARGRSKKLSDLWIDAKIARERRPGLALLLDARGEIFFAEGLRMSSAALPPLSRAMSFRFRPSPVILNPDFVEQRAANLRANIPASIDEESR